MLVEEILIGAMLGVTARLTISALEVAGSVIAQQLGLGALSPRSIRLRASRA
jgi:flagellar biosynthetic protein FliR